jgi:hypothetical protein
MLKKILLLLVSSGCASYASAQSFTKVSSAGTIVSSTHDGAWGSAWTDYNNDGYVDLYVTTDNANMLFKNNGNGTFTSITSGDMVTSTLHSRGCAWGDYNNDGKPDLIVGNNDAGSGAVISLYENGGSGSFSTIASGAVVTDVSDHQNTAWVDLDNDGYLDIVSANYFDEYIEVFYNNGDGTFTKEASGTMEGDKHSASSLAFGDFNNDGLEDVFVGQDGTHLLFINNGDRKFTLVTSGSFATASGGPIRGASWGDYNNDGYQDLFIAKRFNNHNELYKNNSDGTFTAITGVDITNDLMDGEGGEWVDVNNDGWLDLFVVDRNGNGNHLYMNNGDGSFTTVTTGDIVAGTNDATTTSWADYDNDGDMDCFVGTHAGEYILLQNNTSGNNYLAVSLTGTKSNHSAYGAKVRIKTTVNGKSMWQVRELTSQNAGSYSGQNDPKLIFGLGKATSVDSLKIEWPSGLTEVYTNVSDNQHKQYVEGSTKTELADLQTTDATVQLYPNPVQSKCVITAGYSATIKSISLYNTVGQLVTPISTNMGTSMVQLDMSNIAPGIYILNGQTSNGSFTRRVVVSR